MWEPRLKVRANTYRVLVHPTEIKGYVVDFREFLSLVSAAIRYNRSHEFQPTAHSDVD